jgi:hypothetical protein
VSRRTCCKSVSAFIYGAFTLFRRPFQNLRLAFPTGPCGLCWLFHFRSPLLAESFLFLRVLRCFSSPGSLVTDYTFIRASTAMPRCGFPHSDTSGSCGHTHLTRAFRSVSRPSSAFDAIRHSPYALVASPPCATEILTLSRYVFTSSSSVVKVLEIFISENDANLTD